MAAFSQPSNEKKENTILTMATAAPGSSVPSSLSKTAMEGVNNYTTLMEASGMGNSANNNEKTIPFLS